MIRVQAARIVMHYFLASSHLEDENLIQIALSLRFHFSLPLSCPPNKLVPTSV